MLAKKPGAVAVRVEEAVRQVCGAASVDGEQVRAAIAAVARSGQVAAVTLLPTTSYTPTTAPVSALPAAPRQRRSRRLRSLAGFGGGVLGMAVLAGALFAVRGGWQRPDTPVTAAPAAAERETVDSTATAVNAMAGLTLTPTDPPPAASDTAAAAPPAGTRPRNPTSPARPEPAVSGSGSVLLGTRGLPAVLYVDGKPQGAVSGLRSWPVPAGTVRISIRLEGCTPWDSTVAVEPNRELRIGYRNPQCAS